MLLNMFKAYVLRYIPGPFGRYRRRYRFHQKIKNSSLILRGRLRHSNIVLPLNLGDWVQYWMFMEGAYERQLVDFLLPYVKGKVFFDVGANAGSYTMTLAKAARQIYSFEASPSNAAILRNFLSISGLGNIEIVNKAVSDASGKRVTIFSSPDTGGNNTCFNDFGRGGESIETITLDKFVQDRKVERVDVIKMDIEGSELAAFSGAKELLQKHRPLLLIEFHSLVARQAGWELKELYSLLSQYGYDAHELVKRKLVPFDSSRLASPDFYANLIFIHSQPTARQ
jgi:FkbM family methyltransferase